MTAPGTAATTATVTAVPRLRRAVPVLLLVVVLAAWLGLRALSAQQHLDAARADLGTARAALLDRRVADARPAVDGARAHTLRARNLTSDPVWRVAAAVPVLGRSLASVRGLINAVDELAAEVLPPGLRAAQALSGQDLRTTAGAVDLSLVAGMRPELARSADRLSAVRDEVRNLPSAGVVGPVARARTQLAGQLDDLAAAVDDAQQVVQLAPPLLGADRPRRYFVLVQQPGESRGTGGLPGGFAVLEADRGRVRVTQTGSNRLLKSGDVPVPPGVSDQYAFEYGGNLGFRLWSNVGLSPDLPSVARVVAARWNAQGGKPIDGVVAMDPTAMADLLAGGDPLDMGGGRRVAPQDLVRYLTVDQYRRVGGAGTDQSQRKDALSQAARGAAERLSRSADLEQLVLGLSSAVRSGHLRMASDDPALAPGLAAAGIDGALPRGPAPVAYAVVQNATQGKLDSFLSRHVTYRAGACRGVTRSSTITVELRNNAPARGLPAYLTNRDDDGVPVSSTDSAVLLQTYATRGAELRAVDLNGARLGDESEPGGPGLHDGLEADLPFWALRVELPRGKSQTVTLHLEEPVVAGEPRVPEQPLVLPLRRTVDAPVC